MTAGREPMDKAETAALREALRDLLARAEAQAGLLAAFRIGRASEAVHRKMDRTHGAEDRARAILAATEAVREPAVGEPEAEPGAGGPYAWLDVRLRAIAVALHREHCEKFLDIQEPHDPMAMPSFGTWDCQREADAAYLALREHEGRDAGVAGLPQIDVERLATAEHRVAAASYRAPALRQKALDDKNALRSWRDHAGRVAAEYARLAPRSTDKPGGAS